MSFKSVIGVDIGGTKISAGILNLEGKLIETITLPTLAETDKKTVVNQIKMAIITLIDNTQISISEIKGIGVCAPGPLNPKTGYVYNPPNIPPLWETNLKEIIENITGLPAKVENDANAAGLAELKIGAAIGCKDILYVTVSTGIGTGIIINGEIYHGKNGFAGEGGHLSTNYYGNVYCNCNTRSCIEGMASGSAIARIAKSYIISGEAQDSMLSDYPGNFDLLTAKDVAELALKNDALAKKIILDSAYNIGAWLGGMINLLDPDIIVIGGGITNIGDLFFNHVRQTALQFTYNIFAEKTPIVEAKLKANAGIYGAASLFL